MTSPQDRQAQEPAARPAPAVDERIPVPTAASMRELGERLARLLRPGDLVVLSGPLGAGKTTLVQGIGAGLGVRGPVTSPTFVIARRHPSLRGGPDLVHADAYRLGSRAEVDDLDLDTDVTTSVTVVEWGEGLVEDLAPSFLEIAIAPAPARNAPWDAGRPGDAGGPADARGAGNAGRDGGATEPGDAGGPGGAEGSVDAGMAGDGEVDEPRTVRVTGWGDRWRQAAAASRALSGEAP